MRIVRFLKNSKGAIALVIMLLIVQAFADLALPRYTAQIVDVGIQQSGIEHVSPDEMREDTFTTIEMLLTDSEEAPFHAAYVRSDAGTYVLTDEGRANIDELDSLLATPLALSYSAQQSGDFDISEIKQAYEAGVLTKEDIMSMIDQAQASMGEIDEALIQQQALLATRAEYEALGYDLDAMQMSYLVRIGLYMLGIAAVGMIVSIAVGYIAARTAAKVAKGLRNNLFKKVVSFSDAEVKSFSAASLITRGTNDIQQIQMVIVMVLRMVLYSPILAIGGIFMVSQTSFEMSWIIFLAVAIIFILLFILMRIALPKFKVVQQLIDKVNLVSREILTGVSVIRVFDRQAYEEDRFDKANTHLMKTQLFTNRVMTFMMPLMMLVMNATSVLIVWVGGSYIEMGSIQTGDLIAFITYSMVIIMSFLMLGMVSIMLPRADVAAQRINEVLETEPSINDPEQARDTEIDVSRGATLAFHDVEFSYADSQTPVLESISFEAEPGKTTALVGSTGSGKSTIVKLIERFYDVTSGSITLDGIDIRELSQKELRANVGYIPQKAFLFSGTIESNVEYAGSLSTEELEKALDVAQAQEFVESKEEGIKSHISQGGTNVSGGQRQRLAIARALATDARIFLFDDSFSALDYKTDAALRQALVSQLKNKTIIIVAQRLSTVMSADQIIVLDDGRVVGKGTHEQLLGTCDAYKEIALSQLSPDELMGGGAL